MRIAVYSGSFNPVHNGHLAIAQRVLEDHAADEVWFLISPRNPLKKAGILWPESDRLEMVRLAVKDIPGMKVSDYEFHFPRPSFTVNTLESLKSDYPENDFVLLVGGDNMSGIQRWYKYQRILDDFGLIVYPRPGFSTEEFKDRPNVRIIEAPLLNISATEIREKILNNESIDDLVPVKVADYIRKNLTKKI
jgi:nicotinate-nucleotide adenylyltransferase